MSFSLKVIVALLLTKLSFKNFNSTEIQFLVKDIVDAIYDPSFYITSIDLPILSFHSKEEMIE